jgi:hypothetical protein
VFNEMLESRVSGTCGVLRWLGDVTHGLPDVLLEPNDAGGLRLRAEYILDGNHVHPRYLPHLDTALALPWRPLQVRPNQVSALID